MLFHGMLAIRDGRNGGRSLWGEKLGLIISQKGKDTLAERLRRRPAKPMGSPRVGSNPTGVVFLHCLLAGATVPRESRAKPRK